MVKHYAAAVCLVRRVLEKNSDTLSEQFQSKLAASSRSLVKEIADAEKVEEKIKADRGMMSARGAARVGVGARRAEEGAWDGGQKFLMSLRQLMKEVAVTHPYFVRCIKPNMSLAPDDFNGALVNRQFNCTGTTECVKLMQVGFPSRAPYEDLRSRFKSSLPAEFGTMPSDRFVGLLLVACGGKEGDTSSARTWSSSRRPRAGCSRS